MLLGLAFAGMGVLGYGLLRRFVLQPGIAVASVASTIPADGWPRLVATLQARHHRAIHAAELRAAGAPESALQLKDTEGGEVAVWLRAPVEPGSVKLTVSGLGGKVVLPVTVIAADSDREGDGTPDWMRLHSAADRQAFRRWFTELAERMADTPQDKMPAEIIDCASLLRYAYREALVRHDDRWYKQFPPDQMPAVESVQQWSYPNTPLGAGLFRIKSGPFRHDDAGNGSFAQFADAKTLMEDNTYRVSRDTHAARTGDLIFYRLLERDSQYHSMVITGDHGEWVVYHTGPNEGRRGEMRRVLLADLLQHPNPSWRPLASNPNFLGIYRWNLLREP